MKIQLPDFTKGQITVVGDVMLDRYWHGNTERISPEAPVPVVHVKQCEEKLGGAGNVAFNIRALGGNVSLYSICGNDEAGNILKEKCLAANIFTHFEISPYSTITKLRILSSHQQLIRLDFEENYPTDLCQKLYDRIASQNHHSPVLILSDYGKGTLTKCQPLIKQAKMRRQIVLIDPKGNDFTKYHGADLLTPNRKEFETVVGTCHSESDLIQKGLKLIDDLDLQALLITRGSQGMTLLQKNKSTLHLPAKAREVFDVTGAGDTVIAVLAAALSAGSDIATATAIANSAAGIAVGKLGAATIHLAELRRSIEFDQSCKKSLLTEEQLMIAVADAKIHGERIVMTNGCFDILHAGHVAYLEKAKSLGDRLIVAVNDDASVKRLKGMHRPINSIDKRMQVLAGLSAVDWVIAFSEDTPERLINKVLPDILVKGGDYQPEEIAGYQSVCDYGGEVKVLHFVEGCSTSAMINKIKEQVPL